MAIQFNLLPWREAQRERQAKRYKRILLVALGLGIAGGAINYGVATLRLGDHQQTLTSIQAQNQGLRVTLSEKQRLETQKMALEQQIAAVNRLQTERQATGERLASLSQANTQQLFLTQFSQENRRITIVGTAKNDAQVADLMVRLQQSGQYPTPKLVEMRANPALGGEVKDFKIVSQLPQPTAVTP